MGQLYIILFKMIVCIILGFALRKTRVIDERSEKTLSEILLKATLPFTILASSQIQYSVDVARGMFATGLFAAGYYFVSLIVMYQLVKRTKIDDSEKRLMVTASVFANTGFVGLPMMQALCGDTGLLFAAIYNLMYNLFFYTYGAHHLSRAEKFVPRGVFFNPVSLASVLSIVLFVIPWRLPMFITDTFDMVGAITVPLSMIVLGSTFSTVDIKKLFTDYKSLIIAAIRLIVFPLIAFAGVFVAKQFVDILPVTASAIVLITALPCGTMNVIYAEKYNTAPKFAARTVVLSTVLMLITFPLMIVLCNMFFG